MFGPLAFPAFLPDGMPFEQGSGRRHAIPHLRHISRANFNGTLNTEFNNNETQ